MIEAVFENREIKADVTKKAEAVAREADAVFASNTSTLPITGLAEASTRPENFIGLHFFSPVEKMPLVEIIVGKKTSPETLARAWTYVAEDPQDADRGQRQPRLLHQPRASAPIISEGHAHAGRGHRPAADRELRAARRHAGRAAGRERRGQPRALLQGDAAVARGPGREVQGTRQLAGGQALRRGPGRLGRKSGRRFYDYPKVARSRCGRARPGIPTRWRSSRTWKNSRSACCTSRRSRPRAATRKAYCAACTMPTSARSSAGASRPRPAARCRSSTPWVRPASSPSASGWRGCMASASSRPRGCSRWRSRVARTTAAPVRARRRHREERDS